VCVRECSPNCCGEIKYFVFCDVVGCSGLQWAAVGCSGSLCVALCCSVCVCACVCVCVRTCSSNYCIEVKYFAICAAVCCNVLQCGAV